MTIKAAVFDAYGTIFDVHAAIGARLGAEGPAISELWRTKQLEYSWVLSLMGAYEDFWRLTARALDFALARFAIADEGLRDALLDAYRRLEAYPDAASLLARLKARGIPCAILSNGTPAMLEDALNAAKLDSAFDRVLSVDAIKLYKTRPEAYRLACDELALEPGEISFQSSNAWDVAGARQFGFRAVWINRRGLPSEYDLDQTVPILGDLMALDTLL